MSSKEKMIQEVKDRLTDEEIKMVESSAFAHKLVYGILTNKESRHHFLMSACSHFVLHYDVELQDFIKDLEIASSEIKKADKKIKEGLKKCQH